MRTVAYYSPFPVRCGGLPHELLKEDRRRRLLYIYMYPLYAYHRHGQWITVRMCFFGPGTLDVFGEAETMIRGFPLLVTS